MLFEMNENPKVIQQLLGHKDIKTTITVYNSVDNEYIRQTTEKFNEKFKEDNLFIEQPKEQQNWRASITTRRNNHWWRNPRTPMTNWRKRMQTEKEKRAWLWNVKILQK